jgi:HAD superfamily hydrolase (TIGR01509 family)
MDKAKLALIADQYSALFLDNDGTCARTEDLHTEIGTRILRENGVPDMTYEERHKLMGLGEHGIWDYLNKQGRAPHISKEQFKELQCERFREALTSHEDHSALRRQGILDLIEVFKAAGKPVWVVSNTSRDSVEAVQKAIGFFDKVDGIIAFDDIHARGLHKKPSPDPYMLAREKAGLSGEDKCLAVEDSLPGVHSAYEASCDVIHIYYDSVGQKPSNEATYSVSDERDVTEAFNTVAKGAAVRACPAQPRQACCYPVSGMQPS